MQKQKFCSLEAGRSHLRREEAQFSRGLRLSRCASFPVHWRFYANKRRGRERKRGEKRKKMCSKRRLAKFIYCFLLVAHFALSTASSVMESNATVGNSTNPEEQDEEDDVLASMTLAEFKERFRRLIPFVTFYVAHNNLAKAPSGVSPRAHQYPLTRNRVVAAPSHVQRVAASHDNSQKKIFVPSVQYDPTNMGGENDYFMPLKYGLNVNQEDYRPSTSSYLPYHDQQQILQAQVAKPYGEILQKDNANRFSRPLRPPYAPTNRKQTNKPIHVAPARDYLADYTSKPITRPLLENYPMRDEIESLRYVTLQQQQQQQQQQEPVKGVVDSSTTSRQQPIILSQMHRNPVVNPTSLLESFQLAERLPEMLNKNNLDTSIKTLVEILSILHNPKQEEEFAELALSPPLPVLSSVLPTAKAPLQKAPNYYSRQRPKTRPKVITESRFPALSSPFAIPTDPDRFKATGSFIDETKPKLLAPLSYNVDDHFRPAIPYDSQQLLTTPKNEKIQYYMSYVEDGVAHQEKHQNVESSTQHSYEITEDLSDDIVEEQRFTSASINEITTHASVKSNEISTHVASVQQTSLKYGATRGKPHVDYPVYASIPQTDFSCKQQRYKGFFGDPATGCQVWHYCDLNGGKSSFLCPNGTIFSQAALTCDWWFNVKCESTPQLYVLNERLYKYILPIMPKFPEDFTGPEVDRYLEIKFKEMEAKLKEKKLKKQQERKEKAKNKSQNTGENREP